MTLYTAAKNDLLSGDLDLLTDDIRAVLVDAGYTFSAAHDFLDDVGAGTRVATSGALASKTVTNGAFDAADVVFPDVTGDVVTGVVVYKHTGSDATARLIRYIAKRADGTTDISVTPNGEDITVTWASAGIVAL